MRAGTETALARIVQVLGAAKTHRAYLFANCTVTRVNYPTQASLTIVWMEHVTVLKAQADAHDPFRDFERADSHPGDGCSPPSFERKLPAGRNVLSLDVPRGAEPLSARVAAPGRQAGSRRPQGESSSAARAPAAPAVSVG